MKPPFELFYRDFHLPPDSILADHCARTGIKEIGHDDLDSFGPEVSPFFRKYNRDITKLMQFSVAHINPIILSPAIGLVGRPTTIERLGQVLDQITDIFPIGEFAASRHGKDARPVELLNEFQGRVGRITGIAEHHNLAHPRRRFKVLEHLTKQDILMPLALGIDGGNLDRNTIPIPTGHQHHHTKAIEVRRRCTLARHVAQGVLFAPFRLVSRIPNEVELAISGWW